MIEVHHLTKYFGSKKAVGDLSFEVKEGETFVLLGTSGCGKTTTLKMINRLLQPDSGSIRINKKDTREQAPELLRRSIGYVLQDTGLFPHYTIKENICIVPDLLKWDREKTYSRAKILFKKFNLSPDAYFDLYPDQLSGGQQQRVGLVRALMSNPPILLMDEPLGALDPITRHRIRKEFKQLDELKKKTIILVTHDVPEAIELGDRICLMDNGREQQTGSALELLLQPKNDFVKRFFSDDQFMLQLMALKVKELFPYLKSIPSVQVPHTFPPDANMMEAIERLSDHPSGADPLIAFDRDNGNYYDLNLTDLLAAFQQRVNAPR